MYQGKVRLPLISLENEYTFLKSENKKSQMLEFSKQLSDMKRLPLINKKKEQEKVKYSKTARKVEKQLSEIQKILQQRAKIKRDISQQRYVNQSIVPYYIPISFPPNIQMSMFFPSSNMQGMSQTSQPQITQIKQTQPQSNQQEHPQQLDVQKEKQQLNKNKKQIPKFQQRSRINRFRVAAYAVYFSIFFKYFSKRFTQVRRNWFNQRYAVNDGQIILESSTKILKNLYEINIYKMIANAQQKAKDLDQEEYRNPKGTKASNQVLVLIHFINLLLQYVSQYMTNLAFIQEHHEVFTVGILNQNFMISNLYLPQQAALLHIHPQGYIQIQEETQIILLMLKIVVKILVYNFLLGLKYSRQWNTKIQSLHGLDHHELEQIWKITRNAGVFLYLICEEIYETTLQQIDPAFSLNFNEMSSKYNIFCAKSLEEIKRSKSLTNPADQESKLITNLEGYGDMKALMLSNPVLNRFKEKLKIKLIDLLTVIYTSLKYEEMKVYDFIWHMTMEENYLIFKGKKQEQLSKNMKKNKKKDKFGGKDKGKESDRMRESEKGNRSNRTSRRGESELSGGKRINLSNINEVDESETIYDSGNSNDVSQDSDNDFQNEQGGRKKKRKKLKYKYEQAFYDHKFPGHNKLEKLKQKMGKV